MNSLAPYLICFASVIVVMHVAFVLAVRSKRFDVVDVAWPVMFTAAAVTSYFFNSRGGIVQLLVTLLVLIWGFRLGSHIDARRRSSKAEDPRYQALRKKWGASADARAYINIFLLQAVLAMVISLPVMYVNLYTGRTFALSYVYVGFALWLVGFACESVADWQLKTFLAAKKSRDKLMTSGLWHYSRHPNYFGEVAQWWGIYVLALSVVGSAFTVIGPLLITFLILFISGVPLTEKRFEGRKGWAEYKRRTSVLVPWPPRGTK